MWVQSVKCAFPHATLFSVRAVELTSGAGRLLGATPQGGVGDVAREDDDGVIQVEALTATPGGGSPRCYPLAVGTGRLAPPSHAAFIMVCRRRQLHPDGPSITGLEAERTTAASGAVRFGHNPERTVVMAMVMEAAQRHQVGQLGGAAVHPMNHMMSLGVRGGQSAAGIAAATVAELEEAAHSSRHHSP